MAATEASAAPVAQEDGKTPESKPAEAEQQAGDAGAKSETVNSEVVDKDGTTVNCEVVDNKETVNNDTAAAATGVEEGEPAPGEEEAPPQSSESTSSAEPKTSFLDSFLNKSGLGKVMGGRKKKEQSAATGGGGGEENATEGGEKEGEKGGEEGAAAAEGGAEGGAEGDAAIEKAPENGEKEEEKKADKGKPAEAKSTVRDLMRNPVARIFSHRSAEKKDAAEPQKKVRSKSLDRLGDPEALNATADSTVEEGGAAGGAEGGAEGEQKALSSSAATKHMKRWQSFKKLMAQKAHKRSGGGGGGAEDVKEDGAEGREGGGDSSTLDSKESGQTRWKLKRSWTFQGLKRDTSMVGISGKAKGSDKDSADNAKPEEAAATGGEEGAEEAKVEGGAEEVKTEGGEEKAEGGEEEKAATAGGVTVTQHANEIWTSFKKRVIPKSKRAHTECAPSGEEDATAAAATGERTRNTTQRLVGPS